MNCINGEVELSGGAPFEMIVVLDPGTYYLEAMDSFGDGWNGDIWTISGNGFYFDYTIINGDSGTSDNFVIEETGCPFLGDVNGDGALNVVDIVSLVDIILGNSSGECNMASDDGGNGNNDGGLCTGLIGCDGECYDASDPTQLPTGAQYDSCGVCGGGIYDCGPCCAAFGEDNCDGQKACYQGQSTDTNSNGELYVIPGPLENTPCGYDWDIEGCLYGGYGRRGGSAKRIVRR